MKKNSLLARILRPVDTSRGAPMGRPNVGTKPTDGTRIYDSAVPMVDLAYDISGCYWGIGDELRVAYTKDLSFIEFYRKEIIYSWYSDKFPEAIKMNKTCVDECGGSGSADAAVEEWVTKPEMAAMLDAIDPELLRKELNEYGAWDTDELADHEQNKRRILWLAASDVRDENTGRYDVG